jgi:hypothetical protein
MLLADLTGMLSRLVSMLSVSKGMLLPAGMLSSVGMLLAEVAGMLRESFSVLLTLPSMLPFGGMLPASVSAMLKNSASAAFTPAEYIKPFLDISPFCSQKAIRACSTAGSR